LSRLDGALRGQASNGDKAVKDAVLTRLNDFLEGAEPVSAVTLVILGRRE